MRFRPLPLSIWNFTARERSFEQRHALDRAGQAIAIEFNPLVVAFRDDAFKRRELAPSIIREISRRPPTSKNRWFSRARTECPSHPPTAASRVQKAFFGRMTRSSSGDLARLLALSRGTVMTRVGAIRSETRLIDSGFWINNAR